MFKGHQTLLYFLLWMDDVDLITYQQHKQNQGYFISYGIFLTVYPANSDALE